MFAVLVVAGGLASLLATVLSVWSLTVDARRLDALAASGVLDPGVPIEAWHDHGLPPDGTHGCAVQGPALLRWDAGVRTGRIELAGAEVVRQGEHLRVARGAEALACPVGRGSQAELFEALLRARAARGQAPQVAPVP